MCVKNVLAIVTVPIRMQLTNKPLNMNKSIFNGDQQVEWKIITIKGRR